MGVIVSEPIDQPARLRLRQQLDRSVMCLAGAGAGKTHELVLRMVECIRQGRCRIDEIAAITFTRKAAGELRGRFYEGLQSASETTTEDGGDPGEISRLGQAVRHLDRCTIGTIHAFCARILREYPAEAGLPGDFHEVEEREELWLARDAWDRFLEARSAAGDPRLLSIEETGLTAEQFYQFFLSRCQYSDLPLKPTEQSQPDLQTPTDQLREFVEQVAAQIPEKLPDQPDKLMGTVRRLQHRFAYSCPQTDAERAFVLRSFDSSVATQVTLKRWGAPGSAQQTLARSLRDDLVKALRTQIIQPALSAWRRFVYTLAAEFVDEAMDFYRQHRRQQAMLTFNDLMETSAALLRDHTDIRRKLQGRYQTVFVDEFQDTDPLQAQILLYLTGEDREDPSWQQQTPRPGSLFLVGDEKQSIYRFRRADVDVFRHMRQRIEAGDGACIELTASFRSQPTLARWTNDTFEGLFEAQDLRFQTHFQRMQAQRSDVAGGGVYRLKSDPQRRGRQQLVEEEADRIARFIAAAVAGKTQLNGADSVLGVSAQPGDFMILTRTRRWLSSYGRALEQHGIAYDITGAGSLRASGELKAIVDALEVVLRTDDTVALVATMRGLLFGFGDDELYALRQAGWSFRLDAEVPTQIDASLRQQLQEVVTRFHRLREDLESLPPAAALERFVDETGLLAAAAAEEGGSARAGNVLRLLSMVRDWQSRRGLGWVQITDELRDLLEGGEFRMEEMTLEIGRQDVVRVMNLHQAKGLEAKVVFLADPTDSSADQHGVDLHVSRLGDEPYLSMAVTAGSGHRQWVIAEPDGWPQDAQIEARYLAAEQLRLVYVAATRAAAVLIVGQGPTHAGPWKDLQVGLRDVDDLPIPSDSTITLAESVDAGVDIAASRRQRQQRWAEIRQPTWKQGAVRDVEGRGPAQDIDAGHGQDFGVVVHRLLELCVRGHLAPNDVSAVEALALAQLAQLGQPPHLLPHAIDAVTGWAASDLWTQVQASTQVHAEVPYARTSHNEILSVERGVIDLVFRTRHGWQLVDYKTQVLSTDQAGSPATRSVAAMLDQYRAQLAAYTQHWQQVAQEQRVTAGLWLTAHNLWLPLDLD